MGVVVQLIKDLVMAVITSNTNSITIKRQKIIRVRQGSTGSP